MSLGSFSDIWHQYRSNDPAFPSFTTVERLRRNGLPTDAVWLSLHIGSWKQLWSFQLYVSVTSYVPVITYETKLIQVVFAGSVQFLRIPRRPTMEDDPPPEKYPGRAVGVRQA